MGGGGIGWRRSLTRQPLGRDSPPRPVGIGAADQEWITENRLPRTLGAGLEASRLAQLEDRMPHGGALGIVDDLFRAENRTEYAPSKSQRDPPYARAHQ